jgi:hypothetical protein
MYSIDADGADATVQVVAAGIPPGVSPLIVALVGLVGTASVVLTTIRLHRKSQLNSQRELRETELRAKVGDIITQISEMRHDMSDQPGSLRKERRILTPARELRRDASVLAETAPESLSKLLRETADLMKVLTDNLLEDGQASEKAATCGYQQGRVAEDLRLVIDALRGELP